MMIIDDCRIDEPKEPSEFDKWVDALWKKSINDRGSYISTAIADEKTERIEYAMKNMEKLEVDIEYDKNIFIRRAVMAGNIPLVKELLNKGADVNAYTNDSNSPKQRYLVYSALVKKNSENMFLLLMEHGADIHKLVGGNSLLQKAMSSGMLKATKLLLQNKAPFNSDNASYPYLHRMIIKKNSAIDAAKNGGNNKIVELIEQFYETLEQKMVEIEDAVVGVTHKPTKSESLSNHFSKKSKKAISEWQETGNNYSIAEVERFMDMPGCETRTIYNFRSQQVKTYEINNGHTELKSKENFSEIQGEEILLDAYNALNDMGGNPGKFKGKDVGVVSKNTSIKPISQKK